MSKDIDERIIEARDTTKGLMQRAIRGATDLDTFVDELSELYGEESRMTLSIARTISEVMELWEDKTVRKMLKGATKDKGLQKKAKETLLLSVGRELAREFHGSDSMVEEEDEKWYKMMKRDFNSDFAKAMKSPKFRKVWDEYKEAQR